MQFVFQIKNNQDIFLPQFEQCHFMDILQFKKTFKFLELELETILIIIDTFYKPFLSNYLLTCYSFLSYIDTNVLVSNFDQQNGYLN